MSACAAMKVCWTASSASEVEPSMWRGGAGGRPGVGGGKPEAPAAVAVVEHFEGAGVALADVLDQPFVGESGQKALWLGQPQSRRSWRGSGFHSLSIDHGADF